MEMHQPDQAVKQALEERVKELACLYSVTELLDTPNLKRDEVLQACVECLPAAWQHPDVAAARIVIHGREYRTAGFAESRWTQSAEMVGSGPAEGYVEVCYLFEMPKADDGPFLAEEAALIKAVARHLGRFIERERERETLELNEARLNSLLRLFQRSTELDEKEIIQHALEEAVKLTDSAIGYCHLVHEDQASIELVTWSNKTLEICDAVHDTHYPIEQAGVWADCARLQAPVVHNDYLKLAERQGLPDGHAPLVRHLSVPVVEGRKVSVIMGVGNKATDYDDADIRQLQLLANDTWQIVRRKRVEDQLKVMATTDVLTGVANRRHLFDRGSQEVRRIQRYGGSLSVLLLDIDSFKAINDSYGHDVGDTVLRDFAGAVKSSLRDVDIIGRVGGEEFAVLMPNTSPEEARASAERIVDVVRKMSFSSPSSGFGITVSIGFASCSEEMKTFDALLKAADIALYGAKRSGRDCVFG
jgi:diguanylate cyclase (GGDEF)-like protein